MEIAAINQTGLNKYYLWILILSAAVFFIPYLGYVHLFDWDEINFAESAREMIVSGNYHRVQINFQPFWEKPPLFFWLQVACMKTFGINEFAARLPNAIFGIITLVTFYFIGKKYQSPRFGFLWALAYFGTFLPHLYFKSAIIDPVFNYFIFLGLYFMFRSLQQNVTRKNALWNAALSGLLIGLATLTKGPVGLLVFLISFFVYFIFHRFKNFPDVKKIILFTVFFVLVCLLWFGQEILENGLWFLKEFLAYQAELFLHPVASHGEPFYYHFVVVFIGCFPISILALPVIFKKEKNNTTDFRRIMKILFWTVMILFSLTTTKIVHYSSITYMPLAFMAAIYLEDLIKTGTAIKKWVLIILIIIGLLFSFLLAALPYVAMHPQLLLPYLKDPYAAASLNVSVHWSGFEMLIGVAYLLLLIISFYLFTKRKNKIAIGLLFYATATCLFIYLLAVVPKIEKYSQGPAIEFYKSLQGKSVYIWPIGFKSYGQYFYAKKPATPVYGEKDEPFLLRGDIKMPAYFVVKVSDTAFDTTCAGCKLIKQEGGFKFYRRDPGSTTK